MISGVAQIIHENLTDQGLAVRYAGDEFFAVLPHTELAAALGTAQHIQKALEARPIHPARPVTVSIGVAQSQPREAAEQLIYRADQATYDSKRRGKNQIMVAQG